MHKLKFKKEKERAKKNSEGIKSKNQWNPLVQFILGYF